MDESATAATAASALPALDFFTGVVEREHHALYVFLRGLVGDADQAYDLMQDAFHDAWRAVQAGTAPLAAEEMRRWLFQAAYHRAISALRHRRLIHWESLDQLDQLDRTDRFLTASGHAANAFENEIAEREALRAALARLAPPDVACLLLRLVYGFSAAEVGCIVGASPEVVTKRLSRAKQRLRAIYLTQNTPAHTPVKEPLP